MKQGIVTRIPTPCQRSRAPCCHIMLLSAVVTWNWISSKYFWRPYKIILLDSLKAMMEKRFCRVPKIFRNSISCTGDCKGEGQTSFLIWSFGIWKKLYKLKSLVFIMRRWFWLLKFSRGWTTTSFFSEAEFMVYLIWVSKLLKIEGRLNI